MYQLRRNEVPATVGFWDDVAAALDAPLVLRELVQRTEVSCRPTEAEVALAWARRQGRWIDRSPPVRVVRPSV